MKTKHSLLTGILSAFVLAIGSMINLGLSTTFLLTIGIVFGAVLPITGLMLFRFKKWKCTR